MWVQRQDRVPQAHPWAPRPLTRSIRFDFQREGMSANCFIMPFKFTMMAAARTAWVRGGYGSRGCSEVPRCRQA